MNLLFQVALNQLLVVKRIQNVCISCSVVTVVHFIYILFIFLVDQQSLDPSPASQCVEATANKLEKD